MSTPQRIHARTIVAVDRATADVLRLETTKVLMFEHDAFEDLLDYCPEAQRSLAMRYRNAIDVIAAVGWDPEKVPAETETFEVALTEDLINLLHLRRYDLAMTNADRLDGLPTNKPIDPDILAEVTVDRLAAEALDRLFTTYARATKAART